MIDPFPGWAEIAALNAFRHSIATDLIFGSIEASIYCSNNPFLFRLLFIGLAM